MRLEPDQVAVVTGAASGLGLALARSFASRGLHVVLADLEQGPLDDAVRAVGEAGTQTMGVATDVSSERQVTELATRTLDRFGRVEVICNNAGVTTLGPPMWEVPRNDWKWVLSVNLGGVINGIQAFVPHLVERGSGHVVNTASMAGITVAPRQGPYTASKHAVVALSEALALDLSHAAPDVGVTVVCPGVVATNIHEAERHRPAELDTGTHELSGPVLAEVIEWAKTLGGPPMSPEDAAAAAVAAVEANRLYVAPNGASDPVRARVERLLADLDGG